MQRKLMAVLITAILAAPAAAYAQGTTAPKDTGMTKDRPATAPGTSAPRTTEAAPKAKSGSPDSIITGKVKTGFIKDKIVRSRSYNVDTRDGVVTVRGTARSQAEADRAMEIAKGTEGATSVKSEIKVQAAAAQPKSTRSSASTKTRAGTTTASATQPSDPLARNEEPKKEGAAAPKRSTTTASSSTSASKEGGSPDALITTKIKAEYAKDKTVGATRISVDTNNGVVNLSGMAKSQAEADKAVALAKGIKGVTSVKNDIKVEAK